MAWDDRFQEEPDYKGPLCPHCDAPINEDNTRESIGVWSKVSGKWTFARVDGCRFDRRLQCISNAILFLEDEILRSEKSGDEPHPDDAIMELCDGFNLTYPKEML